MNAIIVYALLTALLFFALGGFAGVAWTRWRQRRRAREHFPGELTFISPAGGIVGAGRADRMSVAGTVMLDRPIGAFDTGTIFTTGVYVGDLKPGSTGGTWTHFKVKP